MASACVPICYFGKFQKNENGQWEWRWTSEGDGVKAIFITRSTLFTEMYHDIKNMLTIDSSQYDMELGFLFQKHSTISIPPMKITSEVEMKHLIKLNQGRKSTPICVTLLRKNVPVGEQEVFDEEDRNVNDVCDRVQIAHKDDVVIPETVVTHQGHTITRRIPSTIDDNKNENAFTNENLIALSHGKHESGGSSKAGPSTRSSNCSRVVPNDEDVYVEQLFESKKDLQEAMHRIALKHNFEFKVKKSNKSTYTIICIDDSCHWHLRATKMDTNELFVIRKYAREHTCEVGIRQNDHRQARAWFIGREIMQKFQDPRMIYKPSDIINDVRREYGVVMSYQKAWKAKECALEDLIGLVEESYAKLARYCYNKEKTNTGSTFYIEMDGENHFKYFFMALGQCVRGFRNAMRPLILIDVVTLKVR
ncbi:uncharacterized protein LOC111369964 isoform X2 [Olea europaea var. sylvestris]|uniref:uncharacterized protein LOC111369964 isoform X2 n=1 Tax=Olea europaea var. sylvestris TaxID=158386 RepID=UPI000C1D38DC|nr:uncharacterized protein LOC111369964 isoform X2 [Olea europaea var. sylvestris]